MDSFVPTRRTEVKKGKKWEATDSDPMVGAEVYRALAEDMMYKYIYKGSFIKSIKRKTNYDGTQTIIVTYDHNGIATNDVRAIYHIRNC